jgi:thiol-disulfide isomerase/thioredoxin
MPDSTKIPADVLLLIAPGCPHCKAVLEALSTLVKKAQIGRLEIVNIAVRPEIAADVGTRSVPWTRIGPFELPGDYSPKELAEWAEHAAAGTGMPEYLSDLLETQKLSTVVAMTKQDPQHLNDLLSLASDLDTPMGVRIGVAAAFEELAEEQGLVQLVDKFGEMSESPEPQLRADACHYLGLTHSPEARSWLEARLNDENDEVREIAEESLHTIAEHSSLH